VIGPYKLLQPIAEGGMGTVYMAEQTQPVRRAVALKLIKAGLDSRQVLARFEAERQALALMDHPNIAKVLDAGATEQGRPYFVMELVKGIPITRFCDEHRLSTRERLELAIPVCQAVQHAHQKGIIHRDLKPSNVLVALYDDKPVPKVIDFGVAKATGPRLTDQTLYTEFGAVVGTLEYMSPEQAQLNQLDIDTRSDIYSLGVLLYELLTGSTPLDRKRLKQGALLEMLRVIREEESPRPSMRLSTTEELPSVAACRSIEPRKLSGLVRGELDWIVMKALEKDRTRRYETANGLAADLRRYLDDEPVRACPPSASYRFRKFARRHRGGLAGAVLVSALLLTAVVVLLVANYQVTRQRNIAEREHERAEVNHLKARAAVDDYLTTVSESTLLRSSLPGLQPLRKELLQTALRYYQDFVRENQTDPAVRFELAAATFRVGVVTAEIDSQERGLKYLVDARELFQGMAAAQPSRADYRAELGRCLIRIGYVLADLGKSPDAMASFKQGIDMLEAILPDRPADDLLRSDLAFGHHYLSIGQVGMGMHDEGSQHSRRAIELRQELADRNPSEPRYRSDLALSINNLSFAQFQAGRPTEALQTARNAEALERLLVREQPWNASVRRTLSLIVRGQANNLRSLGRKDESLDRFRESAEIMDKLTTENPLDNDFRRLAARSFAEYAQALVDGDRLELATQALARAQEHAEVVQKENPKDIGNSSALSSVHRNLGKILGKQGKPAEAMDELRKALAIDERIAPERAVHRYDLACSLAQCCAMAARVGASAEAERYAEQAMLELRNAWDQGWKDVKGMDRDPDLDALRPRPDFKAFLQSVHENTDRPKQ
jgi:serine/threonine protein kinase